MKIYVITEGCYSDYHIVGVATDREMAEKIRQRNNEDSIYDDATRIEEYDTEVWEEMIRDDRYIFKVWETPFGELVAYRENWDIEEKYSIRNKVDCNNNDKLSVYVLAKSVQHARKIGSDMFAKYKAEKEGL